MLKLLSKKVILRGFIIITLIIKVHIVKSSKNYEPNALLNIKKFSNTNIIIKKKLNLQGINIKFELNALNKIKKVTNASKNVIDFLNKHITQIINGNKVQCKM